MVPVQCPLTPKSCCETHSNDTTSAILVRIEHDICSMSCRYQQNVSPNYSNLTIHKFISTVLLVTRGCKSRGEMWTDVPQLSEGHKKITAEQITRTSFPLLILYSGGMSWFCMAHTRKKRETFTLSLITGKSRVDPSNTNAVDLLPRRQVLQQIPS